ncbi:Gfo/Idh/MocA family protein [Verrucomicrobium spinosum]|uniref:Gfo/Idh/MocA family protein n=2 Tax=Verrucomicrobium spinosum TaxID=2736 RepID=UPI00017469A8|nr:Gfo/Idh/MocA family oxidoreductase [Verrucomicrobium spinosum]
MPPSSPSSRRRFLSQATFAGGAFFISSRLTSCGGKANGAINVAVVGLKGRGGDHLATYKKIPGVRIAAICDVNSKYLADEAARLEKEGLKVKTYQDYRKLLADKDIDAVSLATPNHWHALGTQWAMEAGKDVFVEKPVSHNVWEGRQIVNAEKKLNRIVQGGTQSRSSFAIREAVAWVQAGNLGKITLARGLCYKSRPAMKVRKTPLPVPAEVDGDLWFGPAPIVDIRRPRLDYDWHWQWAYGNGDLGNQGVHQMDIARWFLGETAIAPTAWSVGGRLGYQDDGQTPNTQIVYQGYEKAPLIFEVRGLPTAKDAGEGMDKFMGAGVGVIIHCENGHVLVPDYYSAIAYDKEGKEVKKWEGADNHYENFIKAVRSRKPAELNAPLLDGHLSAAICHTGNISYQLGEKKSIEEIKQAVASSQGAAETLDRMLQHLQANEVDLNATPLTLGPVLKFDPAAESATGNEAASKLLTREYRAPYVVKAYPA